MCTWKKTVLLLPAVVLIAALWFWWPEDLQAQQGAARANVPQKTGKAIVRGGVTGLGGFMLVSLAFLGVQVWMRVTFPDRCELIAERAAAVSRLKAVVAGLVNLFFLVVLCILFGKLAARKGMPVAKALGVVLCVCSLAALISVVCAGLAAHSERLGRRLLQLEGAKEGPVRSIILGWLVISFLALVPIVGWAVVLYMIVTGAGMVMLSFLWQRKAGPEAAAETTEGG